MKLSLKLKILIPSLVVLSAASYWAWGKFASQQGEQKVSYTPARKDCFDGGSTQKFRYCIHVPQDGKTNGDVAYLLHGRNLDENIWNDDTFYTAMVQSYWQSHKISPPTVVTVSFGPVWLLANSGKAPKSGLLNIFLNEVIVDVEKRTGPPRQRLLFGESMGGLNSLVAAFNAPRVFHKVASLCPPIYTISPFSSLTEIEEFLKRTGADPKIIFGVIKLSRDFVANESDWAKVSPILLVESVAAHGMPEIYMSCGFYDKYGNFEGAEKFALKALERGFKISWRPIYGGHCATDVSSLAEFLAIENNH